jgi:hypothetical protein
MQFSMGTDQDPKTLTAAIDILANHKPDNKSAKAKSERSKSSKPSAKPSQSEKKNESSFAQRGKQTTHWPCNCCGETGHKVIDCPRYATTLPNKWFNPPGSFGQKKGPSGGKGSNSMAPSGMNGFQCTFATQEDGNNVTPYNLMNSVSLYQEQTGLLKDVIILDYGSTIPATFMNDAFLTDIRPSERHMNMTTNAGSKILKQKGNLRSFGEVWYDATQAVNLLGFADLQDRYKIDYEYKCDEFTVHFAEGGPIIFECCTEGLYLFKPSDKFIEWVASTKTGNDGESKPRSAESKPRSAREGKSVNFVDEYDIHYFDRYACEDQDPTEAEEEPESGASPDEGIQQMVTTVEENRLAFTPRQFENAKRARRLHHIMGRPTPENLKALIKMNAIKDCPVQMEDVDIAVKIFGPDIGSLKGKSVRRQPPPVRDNVIQIPTELTQEHKNLVLCIDIMFVNGQPLLTAIDQSIRFRSLVPLESRSKSNMYEALDKILRMYGQSGF